MVLVSSFGFRLASPFFLTTLLTYHPIITTVTTTTTTTTKATISINPLPKMSTTTSSSSNDISTSNDDVVSLPKHQPQQQQQQKQPQPRYNGPSIDEMTDRQKQLRTAILQSRPRTGLNGPFGPWLAVPDIAEPASSLGKACRYDTSLSFRESEMIILLTGAKMKSHTEFEIHTHEAIQAGWSMDVISAIPRNDEFTIQAVETRLVPLLKNDRERSVVRFTTELLDTCTVSDETYLTTKAAVDNKDSVLVEITSIVGYYTYVSYTLNVFNIQPN
ncbi:hypothetical protein IV203_028158 [Nitzschia inconspicua]|uniref:Carboxymuconolactone decarboxylase-like domain-containing protein n=1 Tax=Nitzschia inconspicua TaxID=303405 RepID=A0A9K3LY12_9STRA|nr:hypothetical protein IV203_028182 [Nitzschia inconspicua]KAG7344690.1 hypothetical protein IV203_032221 [Nitzschia inconspicua]KAG7370412.1 hypothetical protein IV203_028158 [Nitzschia inconspicua]